MTVWLFDLDDTLHDASSAVFGRLNRSMTEYIEQALRLPSDEADRLRREYWQRYGATLLGLIRHHGVRAPHFLEHTHRLPGLEADLRAHPHDLAALRRLPGEKVLLTNAPRAYALRVLRALGIAHCFRAVVPIEEMRMFGHWRPKPDTRMFRRLLARLKVPASRAVLVEDTLVHQRSARRVGMRTIWMQRWVKDSRRKAKVGIYVHRKPAYVCARITSLQQLRKHVRR